MKIQDVLLERDVEDLNDYKERVNALSLFLIGRANNEDASSELSPTSFFTLLRHLGVSMDFDTLSDMMSRGELQDVIRDATSEKITFKSQKLAAQSSKMPLNKAEATVKNMARRAMSRRK